MVAETEAFRMKAIIVAAGMGNRLVPLTNDKPKCMLKIGDKTIMQLQLEVLRQCAVNDIVVVKGYKRELINYQGVRYYENTDYENNNILASLFYADKEMNDEFIFSYSDILYTKDVIEKLLQSKGDINSVIDIGWAKHYIGRTNHPVAEAELVQVKDARVIKIGKNVMPEGSYGEFIGLAKFSKRGAEALKSEYHRLLRELKPDKPFQNAKELKKAYLTDMIQELIDRGFIVGNVNIKDNWVEIDTDEDLERARREWLR